MNKISENKEYTKRLLERFVKYVKIWSESDGNAADQGVFPSTERQWDMAELLEEDMKALGMSEVQVKDCYVYGRLPANSDGEAAKDSVLFLAHMDTVDEVTGKDVKPQIFENYEGSEIKLNNGVVHNPANDQALAEAAKNHETIITTDGTTLLGGDDKCGIAAILTAIEYLQNHKEEKHCNIEVIFSPDEETGHGMDKVPLELIKSKYACTVDGGNIGELESECFNAWGANVTFIGKACHTGDAKKGRMVNAVSMAGKFLSLLPHTRTPETTENYEGFIAPMEVAGSIDTCKVQLLLRSFTPEEIELEKKIVSDCAEAAAISFNGKVEVNFREQYKNMKEKMTQHPEVLEKLRAAFREAGVAIVEKPIRGGTDGSRLTEMGIPCPNIFTGGHKYHSRYEWVSLNQMAKAADILINLVRF
ncbi:peptidase T [Treponema sp. JC4]|uniref:peptidase T n=1 Tax=Treponema sp. JC4 TaxID=1124982 RepID=UPI00025AFB4D|nr:peptidase T [Treponema sp. JC4]EID86306.1 peptidase T [Treponema sp. JC4]